MIYAHLKVLDNKNNSYIFENPEKSKWALIKNDVTLKELPTRNDLVKYRQCMIGNETFIWLTNAFKVPIFMPSLTYFLIGYIDDFSSAESKSNFESIVKEIVQQSKILIFVNQCFDKKDELWSMIKEDFIKKYPNDYKERIFAYTSLYKDSNLRQKLIEKLQEKEVSDAEKGEGEATEEIEEAHN